MSLSVGAIIIGDEILSGRRADKHLSKLIELLSERGLSLSWARYLGDDPARLQAALHEAFASADVVFSFGGIGATPDDHTRQCAAAALGQDLVLHAEAKALIESRMRDMAAEKGEPLDLDSPDNVHRLNMGVFPASAQIIPNPYNKIPGFSCQGPGGGTVYFVPGFPVMAWPMVAWVLDHHHAEAQGQRPWAERSLVVFGAMEAALTPLMLSLEANFAGVKVFSLPSVDHPEWGRHIELGVKGEPQVVDAAYAHMVQALEAMGTPTGPELVR
jgi:molybdopterin-biosynthesis enzyme MoeA-like protein